MNSALAIKVPFPLPPFSRRNLELTSEADLGLLSPRVEDILKTIAELDPGFGNSFACLSIPGNTYIQTLRGDEGYHLECRITRGEENGEDYTHFRAYLPDGSPRNRRMKKADRFASPGQQRDILPLDLVTDAFLAFFHREPPPPTLHWRPLDL